VPLPIANVSLHLRGFPLPNGKAAEQNEKSSVHDMIGLTVQDEAVQFKGPSQSTNEWQPYGIQVGDILVAIFPSIFEWRPGGHAVFSSQVQWYEYTHPANGLGLTGGQQ
jgi:hypothetical protein